MLYSGEGSSNREKAGIKRTAAALALLVGSPVVTSCTLAELGDNKQTLPSNTTFEITTYKGRDLKCMVEDGPRQTRLYDCDFPGFYAHPDYKAPPDATRIPNDALVVHHMSFGNDEVNCLVYNLGGEITGSTCDFVALTQVKPR